MRKKLSELSPSELKKKRIISATVFAILICIFVPDKSSTHLVEYIIFGIFAWVAWFIFFHRLAIWFEKKFAKR